MFTLYVHRYILKGIQEFFTNIKQPFLDVFSSTSIFLLLLLYFLIRLCSVLVLSLAIKFPCFIYETSMTRPLLLSSSPCLLFGLSPPSSYLVVLIFSFMSTFSFPYTELLYLFLPLTSPILFFLFFLQLPVRAPSFFLVPSLTGSTSLSFSTSAAGQSYFSLPLYFRHGPVQLLPFPSLALLVSSTFFSLPPDPPRGSPTSFSSFSSATVQYFFLFFSTSATSKFCFLRIFSSATCQSYFFLFLEFRPQSVLLFRF